MPRLGRGSFLGSYLAAAAQPGQVSRGAEASSRPHLRRAITRTGINTMWTMMPGMALKNAPAAKAAQVKAEPLTPEITKALTDEMERLSAAGSAPQ